MVEMSVAGLALDASSRNPIILLRDPSGRRQVPIWIDHAQAHNIMIGFQEKNPQRPLSHDLMIALLEAGRLKLERVIIHSIEANAFQAVLKIRNIPEENASGTLEKIIEIEARPSDAIALAIRAKCGIWMLESVVAEAAIPVDLNADEEDQDQFRKFIDEVSPAALIRHLEKKNKGKDSLEPPEHPI